MIANNELNDFVEKVRKQSDIVSVVSRYVAVNQKGNNYWGCCPFHNEKTASFSVNPEKGFFYCFGCHAGGNVFKFLSLIENISYFEAIKLQAEILNIPFPTSTKNKSPAQIKKENQEKNLIQINSIAKNFFKGYLLKTSYGELGRKYLKSRGISAEVVENFNLGFAPDSWNDLSNYLINKKNFTQEQLIASGVSKLRKNNSGVYDIFRNRIMIPIENLEGQTVAFGGRVINPEDKPKYLNSPETNIFNKRKLLFGLNRAKQSILKQGYAIIVEGYMDVISLFSSGIKNVIASLGTAFTQEQANLLKKYTRKIYFCYDSDNAGQNSTVRALKIMSDVGIEDVKIIEIPNAKDPDEFIKKYGVDEFKNLISNALPLIDFQLQYLLKTNDYLSSIGKINIIEKLLPFLIEIKNNLVLFSEYRKKIAKALLIDEFVINYKFNEYLKSKGNLTAQNIHKRTSLQPDSNNSYAERVVLKTVWNDIDLLTNLTAMVPKSFFKPIHQEILNYLQKCVEMQKIPDDVSAAEELTEQAFIELSRIIVNANYESKEEDNKAYKDCVRALRGKYLLLKKEKLTKEIDDLIKNNPNYNDDPDYKDKFNQTIEIKKLISKLKFVQ